MQDEQGEIPDSSWDWDRPFDEDFVRGAVAREDSGLTRAERAARIAAQHRVQGTWRGEGQHLDLRDRVGPPRRSTRRRAAVLSVLAIALAAGLVFLLAGGGSRAAGGVGAADPQVTSQTPGGPPSSAGPTVLHPRRLKALPAVLPGKGGYRFLTHDLGTARWDPCKEVHYVIREAFAPVGGDATIDKAFATLSAATGLVFVDDGPTTERYSRFRPVKQLRYGSGFAPVLVTWSNAKESPDLKGDVDGFAGAVPYVPDSGGKRLVTGEVTLDAPAFRGYPQAFQLEILLHELGHLAGLDHVDNPNDIMYFESDGVPARTSYTPGALRGLRLAGQGQCFSG